MKWSALWRRVAPALAVAVLNAVAVLATLTISLSVMVLPAVLTLVAVPSARSHAYRWLILWALVLGAVTPAAFPVVLAVGQWWVLQRAWIGDVPDGERAVRRRRPEPVVVP